MKHIESRGQNHLLLSRRKLLLMLPFAYPVLKTYPRTLSQENSTEKHKVLDLGPLSKYPGNVFNTGRGFSVPEVSVKIDWSQQPESQDPLVQEIQDIEEEFRKKPLDEASAVTILFPKYLKVYNAHSQAELDDEFILSLFSFDNFPKSDFLGGSYFDVTKRQFNDIKINLNKLQSNKMYRHPAGELFSGMDGVRTTVIHELGHVATIVNEDQSLLPEALISPKELPTLPETFFSTGFRPIAKLRDEDGYLKINKLWDFDELVTDVISCQISESAGFKYVMSYPGSPFLRAQLTLLGISPDDLRTLHQKSDLAGIAYRIGESILHSKGQASSSEENTVNQGLQTIFLLATQAPQYSYNLVRLLEFGNKFPDNPQVQQAVRSYICTVNP